MPLIMKVAVGLYYMFTYVFILLTSAQLNTVVVKFTWLEVISQGPISLHIPEAKKGKVYLLMSPRVAS